MQPPGNRNIPGFKSSKSFTKSARNPCQLSAGNRLIWSISTLSAPSKKMRINPFCSVLFEVSVAVYRFHLLLVIVIEARSITTSSSPTSSTLNFVCLPCKWFRRAKAEKLYFIPAFKPIPKKPLFSSPVNF